LLTIHLIEVKLSGGNWPIDSFDLEPNGADFSWLQVVDGHLLNGKQLRALVLENRNEFKAVDQLGRTIADLDEESSAAVVMLDRSGAIECMANCHGLIHGNLPWTRDDSDIGVLHGLPTYSEASALG
jgi:hypothetical protein